MSTQALSNPLQQPPAEPTAYDRYGMVVMFLASLAYLVFLAGALQDAAGGLVLPEGTQLYWWGLAGVYPLFVAEVFYLRRQRRAGWCRYAWHCLIPPLRLAARDADTGTHIWLPRWGWIECNRRTRQRLDDAFALPMILAALLVLPLLAVDYYLEHHVRTNPWLGFFVSTGTSAVWLAFTIEFVVMFSAADRKLDYCKRHWLNLLIILLPFVVFLRALRLAQLARLQQLSRLSRLYRLRGLSMRFVRALVAITLVKRLLHGSPAKRLARLRELELEKQEELDELRAEIATLEERLREANPAAAVAGE